MGRDSKNSANKAFFSYHERNVARSGKLTNSMLKLQAAHGWGTHSSTSLDSDALKPIDACALTLAPSSDPVLTQHGVLYDREAIYQYIVDRKQAIQAELAAFEKEQVEEKARAREAEKSRHESKIEEFVARQIGIVHTHDSQKLMRDAPKGRRLGQETDTHSADASFWLPANTPESLTTRVKPDLTVRCPVTNEPLRLKQLYPVRFTRSVSSEGQSDWLGSSSDHRFICPLTQNVISNVCPAALLRPSGSIISMAAINSIIRKDMIDPLADPPVKLRDKDIIPLRVEGTGFAARTHKNLLNIKADLAPVARF